VFDFTIVVITFAPTGEGLQVLRWLRILRTLRLISVVPSMRKVVSAETRSRRIRIPAGPGSLPHSATTRVQP